MHKATVTVKPPTEKYCNDPDMIADSCPYLNCDWWYCELYLDNDGTGISLEYDNMENKYECETTAYKRLACCIADERSKNDGPIKK